MDILTLISTKNIIKNNQKIYNKLLRIVREQDNPVKQLFSCYNIGNNVPENIGNVNIFGLLYGGIEMPFFMAYVLEKFYGFSKDNIGISLTPMSNYHLRTTKTVSTGNDYLLDTKTQNNISIVLDDNIWNGVSMHTAESIIGSKSPMISGVSEVGLRRINIPSNPFTIREILSKSNSSSNVTPIKKKGGKYENLVNDYILKKLPNLVGKL